MKNYICDKCGAESTEDFLEMVSVNRKLGIPEGSIITGTGNLNDWFMPHNFDLCPACKVELDEKIRIIILDYFKLKDEEFN